MKKILKGILIGASYIVPGVCSATTAISLGEYSNVLEITGNFYKFNIIKKNFKLLLGIIVGAIFTLLLFSLIFEKIPYILMSVFLGINIGMFSTKLKNFIQIVLFIIGLIFVVVLSFEYNFSLLETEVIMILYGLIVALGFVLPGLSGSLLMLNFGVYHKILYSINMLVSGRKVHFLPLLLFIIGLFVGILLWSKVFYNVLKIRHNNFSNIISGMVFGSISILAYQTIIYSKKIENCIFSIIVCLLALIIVLIIKKKIKNEDSYE